MACCIFSRPWLILTGLLQTMESITMDLNQLKKLVDKGESSTLEFKSTTGEIKSAFTTVCGFLNNKGGIVLIGVHDKGKIVGQDVGDNTRQEITRELSKIEPHADITVSYIPVEKSRQVIAISASAGTKTPYTYDARPYWRADGVTQRMPNEHYEHLIYNRKSSPTTWEHLTINDCTISDLDEDRIRQVVRVGITEGRIREIAINASIKEILKKFKLITDSEVRNAAVILFCKDEDKQFLQAELKMARFKGINKHEFLDNKVIRGNVFDLYEHAMNFLKNHLPIAGKIEAGNPFRIDTPAIPYNVLREALVNALAHRDYSSRSGSITLAIYDDRVEVGSTGRLPHEIHLRDLSKEHESHPRNPLIANVLHACRMIERWGRGTQDMIELCLKSGNPKPRFVELTGSFSVVLPLKEPIGGQSITKLRALTSRQQEILGLLEEGPYSSVQIAEKLEQPATLRMVQIDLAKLEKFGIVGREGRARSSVWKLLK